ncbi:MAG: thioredoxin fold domain-containing protein [Candidatus Sedimenticola sp. 6PFRAG7]
MNYARIIFVLLLSAWGLYAVASEREEKPQGEFLGAKPTVYPEWFKESFLDFRDDVQEAADEGRRVLVFFHQEGCPYCNLMVERNLSQQDVAETMQQHLDVIEVNMWGDREVVGLDGTETTEKKFSAALRVQFTPTMLFFNEQGKVILRLNGYIPPQTFKIALDYVIGKKERETSYRAYLAANRPERSSGKLNVQPFFKSAPHDLQRTSGRPLALFFEQKQCPNCDRMHRDVMVDDGVIEQVKRFDAVQLDMWSGDELVTPDGRRVSVRKWASELGIAFAPTIVLFNPAGEEVIRSEAFFKRFHTESIFDYVAGEGYRTEPSFQRYISTRAEHIQEQGRDVDIWK